MTSSDERREVARMLRWFASLHGNVACVTVERMLNLDYSDGFGGGAVTSESVRRLADLIDPTCEMDDAGDVPASVKDSLNTFFCSECGSPIYNDMTPSYCPYCGRKVVRDD